jgi:hypothetical protein
VIEDLPVPPSANYTLRLERKHFLVFGIVERYAGFASPDVIQFKIVTPVHDQVVQSGLVFDNVLDVAMTHILGALAMTDSKWQLLTPDRSLEIDIGPEDETNVIYTDANPYALTRPVVDGIRGVKLSNLDVGNLVRHSCRPAKVCEPISIYP